MQREAILATSLSISSFCVLQPAVATDIAAGKAVFNGNCAFCHIGGKNVFSPQKTLQKEALDEFLEGGRKESSVITKVTTGKGHPSFSGRLSDEDIANVAAYVISKSETGWD
jgi:cytochrome c6